MSLFYSLSPDQVLNAVEAALGNKVRATGRVLALNSVENRVYEIELETEDSVIAKFYRPGRWTQEQILEEHAFLKKLHEAEIPVVVPQAFYKTSNSIFLAVFPKVRGRTLDELASEQLLQVGRYLAKIHNVGAHFKLKHRIELDVETYGFQPLEFLLTSNFMDDNFKKRYRSVVEPILETARPLFQDAKPHVIHGDCHLGNILWNQSGPVFVDFDDLLIGPAVQDIWMISKGRDPEDLKLRDELLSGYEEFREFDRHNLILIEPLRAMRMVHYSAWIGRRWNDPSFPKMFPHFGTARYWEEEVEKLFEIQSLL